jgi:hypothetical protein
MIHAFNSGTVLLYTITNNNNIMCEHAVPSSASLWTLLLLLLLPLLQGYRRLAFGPWFTWKIQDLPKKSGVVYKCLLEYKACGSHGRRLAEMLCQVVTAHVQVNAAKRSNTIVMDYSRPRLALKNLLSHLRSGMMTKVLLTRTRAVTV